MTQRMKGDRFGVAAEHHHPQLTPEAKDKIFGAIGNAINDALAPFGVVATEQPFSPEYLRSLLRQ
jgi:hypothetical protein